MRPVSGEQPTLAKGTDVFELPDIDPIVAAALAEDLGVDATRFAPGGLRGLDILERDLTSASVVGFDPQFAGTLVARQQCVVCGLPVVARVFSALCTASGMFDAVEVFPLVAEGTAVAAGTPVAEVEGPAIAVLAGERSALDFLMVLSGIATRTAAWVAAAQGGLEVCDTRKTVPGLRELSKYAVRVGGGTNHRSGLYDMVLIKDNHLTRSPSIEHAVHAALTANPGVTIQVEADTAEQALQAVRAGAHMVLLDNMDDATLAHAVSQCRALAGELGRPIVTEASGNIGIERLAALRAAGVDRVSSSALTLAPPVDFGLDER